ncbi:transglutaminase-like domain-containing protein [Mangrovivirga cuniculi]|uniref:Transglutaminase-like domain-containing protein n=1 Tax=Mangrovivirga cuniculi TaxID=2715131 RepID=A0A4D7JMW5_9BACT|nr:transglutaminase domain-containing protein [Mangrovivirga cuniculi]QCK16193.1 hypothetical protein DCC35_16300 [Mangrovivirga cuniculi]
MNKLNFLLLLILCQFISFAQKLDDELVSKANKLKDKYEDEDMVILKSISDYEYYIDNKTDELHASLSENLEFLALSSGTEYIKRNYFSDNSFIDDYDIENDRGRSVDYEKYCGHVQSGDIFYSDAKVCAYNFEFDYRGRGINFESKTIFTDPKYLTKIFFSDDLPVEERLIRIKVPDYADIELVEVNFDGYNIQKKESKQDEITTYTYTLSEVEDFSDLERTPGYLHFLPHILILTKSYTINEEKRTVLSSTEDLYGWYYQLTKQISRDSKSFEAKVKEITAGLDSDLDKMKAIYYWVQDNIKYIAFEDGLAGFKPEDAKEVYYNLYGDCKGMANLTREMLSIVGIDARLGWLGTNRIPYTYDIPSLAVDNHMICVAYLNDNKYFLDPTEKFNKLDYNAERIQGKQIMIENGVGYLIDTVRVEPIEKYLKESNWNFTIQDGVLAGIGETILKGEKKKDLLYFLSNQESEDLEKILKAVVCGSDDPDNFMINEYSAFDREKVFNVTYSMKLENNLNSFGDEIYVDLDFYEEFSKGEIEEDRKVLYSFGDKSFNRTTGELKIPVGYKVNYLPEPVEIKSDYYSFNMHFRQKGDRIIYFKEIKILKPILPKEEFINWNKAINTINNFYNDQIILQAAQ